MLKIEITDPESLPKNTLIKTAEFLMGLAGIQLLPAPGAKHFPVDSVPKPVEPMLTTDEVMTPDTPFNAESTKPKELKPSEVFGKTFDPNKNGDIDAAIPFRAVDNDLNLDVNGMPWNARIHSRTKSKTGDGAWRQMRGVNQFLVKKVEAELRRTVVPKGTSSVEDTTSETYDLPIAVPQPPLRDLTPRPTPTLVPSAPPVPPGYTPSSPDPVAPSVPTFMDLMHLITAGIANKTLSNNDVLRVSQENGFTVLAHAAKRPDLIPKLMNDLTQAMKK